MPSQSEIVSAYANAKVLGYEKSFEEFSKLYSQYYNETLKEIDDKNPNIAVAVQNPFMNVSKK